MIPVIARTVANLASVAINFIATSVTFRRRYKRRVSIGLLVLFTAFLAVILFGTGGVNIPFGGVLGSYGGVYGLLYLPLFICLHEGLFFQKIFVLVSQLLISVTQSYLVMAIIEIFIPYGSNRYFLVLLITISVVYAAYAGVMIKFGWSFMKKLFAFGSQSEWALYTFGAMFSYAALMFLHDAPIGKALYIFLLLFILWGFIVMCFAIINTHEKSKQRYEADFARSIISSGREHYQMMNEMYDAIGILRHDYKYHLNTIGELVKSGDTDGIKKYLDGVKAQFPENELRYYCSNSVLNALLSNYAERCAKLNIRYDVRLAMPKTLSVPNYEMCIILGNLLENAVEACQKQGHGCTIELAVKHNETQLLIMIKNSFDGVILQQEDQPISRKKDGGFGLRSVRAVAAHYGGYLLTEWNTDTFTAYVAVKL